MKITLDPKADAVYIRLQEGEFVANREVAEGVILDIGENGVVLGIEILEASTRLAPGDFAQLEVLMPVERAAGRG
ncbi:MAG: DUF2283 domain-containing protein [Anaerolineae bacterium]